MKVDELDKEEQDYLLDGCGKKGGILDVPDFVFINSCNQHDLDYIVGCTEVDRKIADWNFYLNMCEDAKRTTPNKFKRLFYCALARLYYYSVRTFSSSFFYYGLKKRNLDDIKGMVINGKI